MVNGDDGTQQTNVLTESTMGRFGSESRKAVDLETHVLRLAQRHFDYHLS